MFKNILLPIDIAHESSWKKALPAALELARNFDSRLTLVTVVDADPNSGWLQGGTGKKLIDDYVAKTTKQLADFSEKHIPSEIDATQLVKIGSVYREIIHAVDEVQPDLIVMAAHRPSLKEYLLGVNAARAARHAECSILIIRE